MHEQDEPSPRSTTTPSSSPLFVDASTLTLNRGGRMSPDQVKLLGTTSSLAQWLLMPLVYALVMLTFAVGLGAVFFAVALGFGFEVIAIQYGLLLAFLLILIPMVGNSAMRGQVGVGLLVAVGFGAFLWILTQSVQVLIGAVLLFSILAGLSGLSQIAQGEAHVPSSGSRSARGVMAAGGLMGLAFLALWFLGAFALLVYFMMRINWVGPLVALSVFYAIMVMSLADDYFAGRAAQRGVVVARTGAVTWETGQWVAKIGRKTYRAQSTLPPPGLYRFYVVPAVKLVIAAEPLSPGELTVHPSVPAPLTPAFDPQAAAATASEQAARGVLLQSLRHSLHFSLDDLDANQRGHLSTGQFLKRALPQLGQTIAYVYLAAGAGVVLGLILAQLVPALVDALASGSAQSEDRGGFVATVMLCALCALALASIVLVYLGIGRLPFVFSRQVSSIEGTVKRVNVAGDTTGRSLHKNPAGVEVVGITGQTVACAVPLQAYKAFVPGLRYRFYVHTATCDIMSVVPLESTAPP